MTTQQSAQEVERADTPAGFVDQPPYEMTGPRQSSPFPRTRPDLFTRPPTLAEGDAPAKPPAAVVSLSAAPPVSPPRAAAGPPTIAPAPVLILEGTLRHDSERVRKTIDAWSARLDAATTALIFVTPATVLGVIVRHVHVLHSLISALVTTVSITGLILCLAAAAVFSSSAVRTSPWSASPATTHLRVLIPAFVAAPLILVIAGAFA